MFEDFGVVTVTGRVQLERVKAKPKKGQYVFDESTGTYTFHKSLERKLVMISAITPSAMKQVRRRAGKSVSV
jgi:hypothetical protein